MKIEAIYKDGEQAHLRLQEAKEKSKFDYFRLLEFKVNNFIEEKFIGEKTIEIKDPERKAPTQTVTMLFQETPESIEEQMAISKEKYDLTKFKQTIKRWLYIDDDEVLDVVLAGIIGEKIGGDPLWVFLIAPPGGSKTELLRSFTGDLVYHLSDMTSKSFVSGLMLGTGRRRRRVRDLLPELNGKTLIFKDFTTILEKSRDERREIIAQFREVYDGSFAKRVGTADEVIRYESRFGLVAGVTPIIDKHWKVMQQLGERFLKIRWRENTKEATKRARENEGMENVMRKELIENSTNFIKDLSFDKLPYFSEEDFGDEIQKIATFIAYSRTPIAISSNNSDFYYEQIPTPEVPTRLVKQLKKLAKALALIRGKGVIDEEEIKTIKRVAGDTIPPDRLAVLEAIRSGENLTLLGCSIRYISKIVKIPERSIRRVLEQLELLELIKKTVTEEDSYNQIKSYFYKTTNMHGNIFGTVPKMSEDTKECNKTKF